MGSRTLHLPRSNAAGCLGCCARARRTHEHSTPWLAPWYPLFPGEMNDAGEVLLALYERTMGVGRAARDAVNATFGLPVEEQVRSAQPNRGSDGAWRRSGQADCWQPR